MGSFMIWNIIFKNKESKKEFEKFMKNEGIKIKKIHDHYEKSLSEDYGDFYYEMGYLGYAEADELKSKLKKLGVVKLNQICLCDIDGEEII